MPKISKPETFSARFKVTKARILEAGLFDPTLNADTGLFIDPLLLQSSSMPEIRGDAYRCYQRHFETIVKFLLHSKARHDLAWRSAHKLLSFPEIRGTCLGYGANSIHGSAFGPNLTEILMQTASEAVAIGIHDPDLFVAMALFEPGVGPDRISDMTTNVILPSLVSLNRRVAAEWGLKTKPLRVGARIETLVENPCEAGTPVILVPRDILRTLPVAKDWDAIEIAAAMNEELRQRVSQHIGGIWKRGLTSKKDKQDLRDVVLSSEPAFRALLDTIHGIKAKPYDLERDPEGQILWRELGERVAQSEPLELERPKDLTLAAVAQIVNKIAERFAWLIEERDLWRELWCGGRPRPEKSAQRIFFVVADAYCRANNIDVTPEAETGNGPVDFKFSSSRDSRVLVEIKLSTNKNVVKGYTKQLETYRRAEESAHAAYVVIDLGALGKREDELRKLQRAAKDRKDYAIDLLFIDGTPRKSASKL